MISHAKGCYLDPTHFWSFVLIGDGCWEWQGHKNARGYGHIGINNKLVLAHRHALVLSGIEVPRDACVLHRCDNPACVRPGHLRLGTRAENIADMDSKGRRRAVTGEDHPKAKLDWAKVSEIRAAAALGDKQVVIAQRYGVNHRTVSMIVLGRIWKGRQ